MDFKLSEDARDWDSSYRIFEASLVITISAILFLVMFVLIHNII